MLTIMFFGGINLLAFGVIGEYIGRMYESVKGRPLYVMESVYPPIASAVSPWPAGAKK